MKAYLVVLFGLLMYITSSPNIYSAEQPLPSLEQLMMEYQEYAVNNKKQEIESLLARIRLYPNFSDLAQASERALGNVLTTRTPGEYLTLNSTIRLKTGNSVSIFTYITFLLDVIAPDMLSLMQADFLASEITVSVPELFVYVVVRLVLAQNNTCLKAIREQIQLYLNFLSVPERLGFEDKIRIAFNNLIEPEYVSFFDDIRAELFRILPDRPTPRSPSFSRNRLNPATINLLTAQLSGLNS